MDAKETAWRYLRTQRDAVRWKVAGLPEHELRLPRTPTGTNLLGLVKHLAACEVEYFAGCLGRTFPDPPACLADDAEDNADMWATADESVEEILALYERATTFADEGIAALPADAPTPVPWWGADDVVLHTLLVHMAVETSRHLGQMDILREQVDGAAGLREGVSNLPQHDAAWWESYVARLRDVAERTRRR